MYRCILFFGCRSERPIGSWVAWALATLCLLLGSIAAPKLALATSQQEPLVVVGRASLVIGVARVLNESGEIASLERGAAIRAGDRIETGPNGHVHVRFVDGGLVSVRPASRLLVEKYSYSQKQPNLSAIKFKLEEGVVRSITGAWGEAARERFRLNTPLAAIGIKGTDFVVRANADTTVASVYSGAIVLAPLQGDCLASLGPCLTGNERLLSQDMKGQMVALGRQQATAQLLTAGDSAPRQATLETAAPRQEIAPTKVASARSSEALIYNEAASVARGFDAVAKSTAQPDIKQLVWARMAAISAEGDAISKSFEQVLQAGAYQSTVGNFTYGLYRSGDSAGLMAVSEPSANFRLSGGAAQVLSTDFRGVQHTDTAKVDAGTLSVDFAKSTFATQLQVSGAKLGQETVSASGMVQPNGIFRGTGSNTFTAGALSLDGSEAGYFFEKALNSGQLRGITLWGR